MTDFRLNYKIVAEAATAKAEIRSFDDVLKRLGGGISSTLGGAAGPIGAAAAGVAVIGTAAVTATVAMFNLSKQAAEFGSTIFDASKKTGLAAETLSAMKFAADQSGASLEQITGGIAKFAKEVGAAADGSEKAAAKLKDLGIEPQEAINDLDAALAKVFKRIQEAPPGIERITLAQKAFGKSGADLLPFIDSFDGDLASLIKKAKELGVTIDDDAARAADEFGDQLDILSAQFAGVGRTIGTELMPLFREFATETSTWLVENKGEVGEWAETIVGYLRRAIASVQQFGYEIKYVSDYLNPDKTDEDVRRTATEVQRLQNIAAGKSALGTLSNVEDEYAMFRSGKLPFAFNRKTDDEGGSRSGGSQPRRGAGRGLTGSDLFRFFEKELGLDVTSAGREPGRKVAGTGRVSLHSVRPFQAVDVKVNDIKGFMQKGNVEMFQRVAKAISAGFRFVEERDKRGSPHGHFESRRDAKLSSFDSIHSGKNFFAPDQLAYLKKLDAERVGKQTGETGFQGFVQQQNEEAIKAEEELLDRAQSVLNEWVASEQKASGERLDIRREEADLAKVILSEQLKTGELSEIEYANRIGQLKIDLLIEEQSELAGQISTRETIHRLTEIELEIQTARLEKEYEISAVIREQNEEYKKQQEELNKLQKANTRPSRLKKRESEQSFGSGFFGQLGIERIESEADYINSIYSQLGASTGQALQGMIQGVGQLVESWVLYGELGPDALRKMTAQVLASLSAEATVQAIFELAKGFAALFFNPGEAAAHFKAAALFGVVAVGAGIAGRAIAGDSFKNSASSGGGGRGESSTSSGNSRSSNATPSPFSRATDDAFISGRRTETEMVATAIEKLTKRLDSMRPGDVLVRGAEEKRGFIGRQTVADIGANAGLGTSLGRNMRLG